MKELIFDLFSSIAREAMVKGQSVALRYDVDQDENILTLSIYPVSKEIEEAEAEEDPHEDDEEEED